MAEETVVGDISERVETQLMVRRYIRAQERFDEASKEFTEAAGIMRSKLKRSDKFIVKVDCITHLVSVNAKGEFEVEPIKSL